MTDLDRLIALLPQTPPARMVDRVLTVEPGVRAVGEVTFPAGHRVFAGHLPGRPLVPGVMLLEALAQLAGVICVADTGQPVTGYLAAVERLRYRRLVEPDETVQLSAELVRQLGSAARFDVRAEVAGEVACDGELTLGGMRDR